MIELAEKNENYKKEELKVIMELTKAEKKVDDEIMNETIENIDKVFDINKTIYENIIKYMTYENNMKLLLIEKFKLEINFQIITMGGFIDFDFKIVEKIKENENRLNILEIEGLLDEYLRLISLFEEYITKYTYTMEFSEKIKNDFILAEPNFEESYNSDFLKEFVEEISILEQEEPGTFTDEMKEFFKEVKK